MNSLPKKLKSEIVVETKVFTIEGVHLQFSNGNLAYYERVVARSPGAVLIIPLLDDETLLLVREYGGGIDRYELGFPKGGVAKGESVEQAANRELMEEIGYQAGRLEVLKQLSTSPSYNQNVMTIVLARDLSKKSLVGDEPEPLEIVPWKLAQCRELLNRDDFTDARCVAALFLLQDKVRKPPIVL